MTNPNEALAHPMIEAAVREMLYGMGFTTLTDGLEDTPARVARSWADRLGGYELDPGQILSRVFEEATDDAGIVLLKGIGFHSTCEHHLLPFSGTAHVAYLPANGRVVGLSKLARIVDCYARRLQLQERLTREVAEALDEHLAPDGVGVLVQGVHGCMLCRGVKQQRAEMVTSVMLGSFRDDVPARAELLNLIRMERTQ
tara:strand:- start:59 stop:655 length:597 start_codon:yes stop_codon:yes gene_type:complete